MSLAILNPEPKKAYVLDTSALLHDEEAVHSFGNHDVYIPIEVLEELDVFKNHKEAIGKSSRYVNRYLDNVRTYGSLFDGVSLESGQTIYISLSPNLELLPEGMKDTVDNRVIATALNLLKEGRDVTLVSQDISMRVRCDTLGVSAESFDSKSKEDILQDSIKYLEVSQDVIDAFYEDGELLFEDEKLYPNQGVVLKSGQASALGLTDEHNVIRKPYFARGKNFNVEGITPRSKEQLLAFEMLLDPDINLVTLTGFAGVGKTLLAITSAVSMLHEGLYDRIILARPTQSLSKDIGFLPGSKEEKLQPWLQPIFDNLEFVFSDKGKNYLEMLMERGKIQVEALSYVRGRSLANTFFLVDESQNVSNHEAKAILTRMGENSKLVLTGDLDQIDSYNITKTSSGLYSAINLFREFEHAGHMHLVRGERSKLATYAAKVMK